MTLPTDLQNKLKTVKTALKKGLIDADEANSLVQELERILRESNILDWGKYYFKDKFTLPFCDELHSYLIEIADEPLTDTLAPRGHAKTTIKCFLIPIYLAVVHPEKYRHFLNVQATMSKAIAVNLSIRMELETNELLRRDYGDLTGNDKWTEKQFILKNGVVFSALGAGESVRGINYKNIRPDYIVLDDLYDEDHIENPKLAEKIERWFWGAIFKCVANDRKTCIHLQGTAINSRDLMHKLKKSERWKFRIFKAVDWKTEYVLWPEANSLEKLRADREEMGSIIFAREMENEVRDDTTAIVKAGWIQFYDGRQFPTAQKAEEIKRREQYSEIPEHIVSVIGAIDPAEKTKEVNDFTAKIGVIKTNLSNYYIFYASNQKLTFNANLVDIKNWGMGTAFSKVLIETNKGEALFTEIKRTTGMPISGIHETRDKISRFIGQSAKFENGKVFISMLIPEPVRNELVEQLVTNTPVHDDLRDATILGLEHGEKREIYIG